MEKCHETKKSSQTWAPRIPQQHKDSPIIHVNIGARGV